MYKFKAFKYFLQGMSLRDIKVNIVITHSTLKMFPKCSELSGLILVLKKYAIYM